MSTRDDVITYVGHINPDFSSHPSLGFFVDQTMAFLVEDSLKTLYVPACAYKVCASLFDLDKFKKGTAGLITKEKLGDQEVHYGGAGSSKDGGPITNMYYEEYLRIIDNLFGGFVVS